MIVRLKKNLKPFFWVFCHGLASFFVIMFWIIFYTAYFSKEKAVVVWINKLGEANLEAVVFLIVGLLVLFGCFKAMKEAAKWIV